MLIAGGGVAILIIIFLLFWTRRRHNRLKRLYDGTEKINWPSTPAGGSVATAGGAPKPPVPPPGSNPDPYLGGMPSLLHQQSSYTSGSSGGFSGGAQMYQNQPVPGQGQGQWGGVYVGGSQQPQGHQQPYNPNANQGMNRNSSYTTTSSAPLLNPNTPNSQATFSPVGSTFSANSIYGPHAQSQPLQSQQNQGQSRPMSSVTTTSSGSGSGSGHLQTVMRPQNLNPNIPEVPEGVDPSMYKKPIVLSPETGFAQQPVQPNRPQVTHTQAPAEAQSQAGQGSGTGSTQPAEDWNAFAGGAVRGQGQAQAQAIQEQQGGEESEFRVASPSEDAPPQYEALGPTH